MMALYNADCNLGLKSAEFSSFPRLAPGPIVIYPESGKERQNMKRYSTVRKVFSALLLTLFVTFSTAAPSQVKNEAEYDFGPVDPIITKLSDNVYSIFLMGYNSLVVIGDRGVLITDPANNVRAPKLKQAIAKLTDKPVTQIVLSHEHFDHIGGTHVFEGADIIMQQNALSILDLDPLGIGPKPEEVKITFANKYVVEMGTTRVELSHMGAADGVANTVVYLPAEKIVVTADLYTGYGENPALTPGEFLEDVNLLGSRKILNEIAGWDIKYAVDAHAGAMDPALLRKNAIYLNDLYNAVFPPLQKALATQGTNAGSVIWNMIRRDLPATVKLPKYEKWRNYDQLPDHVRRMGMAIVYGA